MKYVEQIVVALLDSRARRVIKYVDPRNIIRGNTHTLPREDPAEHPTQC
jgi:hypothetical protein